MVSSTSGNREISCDRMSPSIVKVGMNFAAKGANFLKNILGGLQIPIAGATNTELKYYKTGSLKSCSYKC